jgi:hypothetical protein
MIIVFEIKPTIPNFANQTFWLEGRQDKFGPSSPRIPASPSTHFISGGLLQAYMFVAFALAHIQFGSGP